MMSPPPHNSSGLTQGKNAQVSSSGSATGNPRNKTALAPGHSLMDWIRLGNSGKDLAGVGGKLLDVSAEQLLKHNSNDDAWIAIYGKVYNVTHYMNFHPGGPDELMRGVGTDATELFEQIHSWVNYDSILKKCLVGRFVPVRLDVSPFQVAPSDKAKAAPDKITTTSPVGRSLHWDWYDQPDCAVIVLYCPDRGPAVRITLSDVPEEALATLGGSRQDRQLNVELRSHERIYRVCLFLEAPVLPHILPQHSADSNKVEIKVSKRCCGQWKQFGTVCPDVLPDQLVSEETTPFYPMTIRCRTPVSHNTYLIGLAPVDATCVSVPVGQHVRLSRCIKGTEVVRSYTPVIPMLVGPSPAGWEAGHSLITLMVKSYPSGAMSSWLESVVLGERVDVSPPTGSFSTKLLQARTRLYLIAAGTGFTPMVGLITWARRQNASRCERLSLLFFNRTEKDILWRDQLEKLSEEDKRIHVEHILSEADESWSGRHGRVNGEVLRDFLPQGSPEDAKAFICVCGPQAFTHLTKGLLQMMDYTDRDYHCFLG